MSTHIISDVETIASQLAIMQSGKLLSIQTSDSILDGARDYVWSAQVDADQYEMLRNKVHILHTQRSGSLFNVRMAHPASPCDGARSAEPSLEEALVAQRFARSDADEIEAARRSA
jgi:ABC-type multidrug transport system ATPase subunit